MTQVVELPLFSDPYYEYTMSLQDQSFIFTFRWMERTRDWYLDIRLDDLTPVVLNYKLVTYYPMMVDYVLSSYGLTGYFLLSDSGTFETSKLSDSVESLSNYYRLFYVYEEEE